MYIYKFMCVYIGLYLYVLNTYSCVYIGLFVYILYLYVQILEQSDARGNEYTLPFPA